ncbi:MAG: ABC transporter ATP-binding protein [Planctomycetota bacterium]|nr:ABC transporter ATP-binding protein [Planctomycetota bacterium]MEC9157013.1 ABC transporter ATP-binding protein [Planctomycetota bacterium]MEC9232556.1 ABC transporter ATP-binding protein [Planctomycetota bacterium]
MSNVRLESIRKTFGETVAVDNVSFEIESGDLFFLLGPSGCGKTTLLRMIAGFTQPTAGTVTIGDRDVTSLSAEKRDAGMVFQSYALWPHMSVEQNVAFGLKVRKLPKARITEEVGRALELVRMQEYAGRRPNELSGGQQQRVALARALAFKPTVLLLDEPLSNLDAKLRVEMRTEIRRIVDELRITTIYVTHDQKEALSLADQMVVMDRGLVVQKGAPGEVYYRPDNRFTAEFLGETNLLEGRVEAVEEASLVVETAAGRLRSSSHPPGISAGDTVTISIRPEALGVTDADSAGETAARIQGRRTETIFLGELAQHRVAVGEDLLLKVFEINPRQRVDPRGGDQLTLSVLPEDVVVLAG